MLVEKYLKDLLFENDFVVIPYFGGFISHYVGVEFDEAKSIILPPSKKIAFNGQLKQNDWVLVNAIMVGEQATRNQAINHVTIFVNTIQESLKKDGFYQLKDLGILRAQQNEGLLFEPLFKENYLSHSYALPEISYKKITTTKEVEITNKFQTLTPKKKLKVSFALAASVLLAVVSSTFLVINKDNKAISSFNPFYFFSENHQLIDSNDLPDPAKFYGKPNKSTSEPEIGIVIKPEVAESEKVESELKVAKSEIASKVEPVIEEVESSKETKKMEVVIPENGFFIVIAGFSTEKQAKSLHLSYSQKGILTEGFVLKPSKEGEPYRVSAIAYNDYETAKSNLPHFKNVFGETCWILKR